MSDNSVTANPTTVSGGPSFATDVDGSGVNWPYAKLAFGASGTRTEVSGSNPMPVTVASGVSLSQTVINFSNTTPFPLCSAVSGQSVKLYRIILFVGGATNITFQDSATALTGPIPLFQGGDIILDISTNPWFTSSVNNTINILSSNSVQVSGVAYYVQS